MKIKKTYSDAALQALVEKVSLEDFGRPFCHQAVWNRRLRTTGGRFHSPSCKLDFNPRILDRYDQDLLVKVIRHELCHYHLYRQGSGYRHGNSQFKELLEAVGGIDYVPDLLDPSERKLYYYRCQYCHELYERERRINPRAMCGDCLGVLVQVEGPEDGLGDS
ncbi:SprT family protein [Aerococcus sp. UMB7834]|uniref:SprT family protein n=1 Tax=Aerococcus sp. UMB7834 TaxID=3046342 RepID=UPI00254AFBD1|nr:SprT family protein [Aerococcus sp. UMB7834]MDK6804318.1 SprT family protein [Aerococcus sp. UMB7834]